MQDKCPVCGVPVPFVGLDGPMGELEAYYDERNDDGTLTRKTIRYCLNLHAVSETTTTVPVPASPS